MRFVIQRVSNADVTVDDQVIGSIQKGFLVLVGVTATDTRQIADKMIKKLIGMRIFEDSEGKTNLDLKSVGGSVLIVSQFTLYADCRKGNRPSFSRAGDFENSKLIYEYIIQECKKELPQVEHGSFGAYMKVSLVNDGPFTIILDSEDLH